MDAKKISLGQFFTIEESWAQPQVIEFISDCIRNNNITKCLDPFAGQGDLLNYAKNNFPFEELIGMDIDKKLNWKYNDSLKNIVRIKNSIIITNPPYLASYSAKRKGEDVYRKVSKYFQNTNCEDLYQVALQKMLEKYSYIVAIIPETFINSSFSKDRVKQITVLENVPFVDTDCPVCVACFTEKYVPDSEKYIYKNSTFIGSWSELNQHRKVPTNCIKIRFNDSNGSIALRAVDNIDTNSMIKFMPAVELDYNIENIKTSSRLITIIDIPDEIEDVSEFTNICNTILEEYRNLISDILLSPFKGNNKKGERRRRLDYKTARAIIEEAYNVYTENRI